MCVISLKNKIAHNTITQTCQASDVRNNDLHSQVSFHSETSKMKMAWKFHSTLPPGHRKGETKFSEYRMAGLFSSQEKSNFSFPNIVSPELAVVPSSVIIIHPQSLSFTIRIWDKKVIVTFLRVTLTETQYNAYEKKGR